MTWISEILDVHSYSYLEQYYRETFENVRRVWIPVSFHKEYMFYNSSLDWDFLE